jgi:hypothetical protein
MSEVVQLILCIGFVLLILLVFYTLRVVRISKSHAVTDLIEELIEDVEMGNEEVDDYDSYVRFVELVYSKNFFRITVPEDHRMIRQKLDSFKKTIEYKKNQQRRES